MHTLRHVLAAGAVFGGLQLAGVGSALASDEKWSGIYIGAGVGYGTFVNNNLLLNADGSVNTPAQDTGGNGGFGTVIAGYDHQIGDRLVLGAFADFDWSSVKGTLHELGGGADLFGSLRQDHAWAIGARAGFLASSKTLLYVSGGYTQAQFDGYNAVSATGLTQRSANAQTYDGWFVGAGIETMLSDHLSLRLEYRHSDFERQTFERFNTLTGVPSTVSMSMDSTTDTARAVLSYKFGHRGESHESMK